MALPVFALPVILVGAPTNRGLVNAAILGAVGFVAFAALGAVVLAYDVPLRWCGRTVQRLRNSILRKRPPMTGLDESLLAQRNDIRACWARSGGRRYCCPPAAWPSTISACCSRCGPRGPGRGPR